MLIDTPRSAPLLQFTQETARVLLEFTPEDVIHTRAVPVSQREARDERIVADPLEQLASQNAAKDRVCAALRDGARVIVLDLRGLGVLGSVERGALFAARRKCLAAKAQLILQLTEPQREVFRVAHLDQLFTILDESPR